MGRLEVLQWARANGWEWDGVGVRHRQTCYRAAEGGHLEVLQWARANGCPWDALTCCYAARGGHLEVLQWARANGCLWSKASALYYLERMKDPVRRSAAVEWANAQT